MNSVVIFSLLTELFWEQQTWLVNSRLLAELWVTQF